MTVKDRLLSGVSPFAHLNGPVVKPAASTEVAATIVAEPTPAPAAAAPKGKKTDTTKSDDDDDDDETDDDGDDESDEEEMRKAEDKKADDDEMTKSKKSKKAAVRSARLRERNRCAAIFGHEAAGSNPALAAQLAFQSNMGRAAAIGVLKTAAASNKKTGLAALMAVVPQPPVSAGGEMQQASIGSRAVAAMNRARGKD